MDGKWNGDAASETDDAAAEADEASADAASGNDEAAADVVEETHYDENTQNLIEGTYFIFKFYY